MVKVAVGPDEKDWSEVDQHWLCNEINGRKQNKQPVCVRVTVKTDSANLVLTTPGCASGGGGGRLPNPREQEILDLWRKHQLSEVGFSCGQVNAFLVQLKKLIGR